MGVISPSTFIKAKRIDGLKLAWENPELVIKPIYAN